ncbi:hypothetical protein QBC45DRAFT_406676 [Copromyces sp. CBS 386.78]|nr:hypothetical protein QBC45DRAFT_406676 [Copromyces sp. CBS 386.78]
MSVATNLRCDGISRLLCLFLCSACHCCFLLKLYMRPGASYTIPPSPRSQLRTPVFTRRPDTTWNLAVLVDAIPVASLQARRHDACPQP